MLALLALLILCLPLAQPIRQAPPDQEIEVSFAVIGGSRLGAEDVVRQRLSNPSSANLLEVHQTFEDIVKLPVIPRFTFMTGDMVNNLAVDHGETLRYQLEAWEQVVKDSVLWDRSELIPMAGNHEVLKVIGPNREVPNPACYPIWERFVRDHGMARHGGNGPTDRPPNLDHLVGEQRYSTYSFDYKSVHFLVVSTDSLSNVINPHARHPYSGWIPVHWITRDLAAAQANTAIHSIFMLGHKPLREPFLGEEHTPIANARKHQLSMRLESLMLATPKFRAYLTGHEHLWEAAQIDPGGPWQFIIGNGGTVLNHSFVRLGGYDGFTVVNVYKDERVGLVNYRRPVPKPRYCEGTTTAALPQPEMILPPRR